MQAVAVPGVRKIRGKKLQKILNKNSKSLSRDPDEGGGPKAMWTSITLQDGERVKDAERNASFVGDISVNVGMQGGGSCGSVEHSIL